jgi:hypothetical protein
MLSRLAYVAVAGSALVTAVGCGGGDGSEGLSRQEFIQQAEAICERAESESDALAEPQTDAELIEAGEQNLSILERMISDLGELEPPSELKADLESWLALADRQATTAGDFIEALREQDQAQVQELGIQLEETEQQADALAAKIGIRACGAD